MSASWRWLAAGFSFGLCVGAVSATIAGPPLCPVGTPILLFTGGIGFLFSALTRGSTQ